MTRPLSRETRDCIAQLAVRWGTDKTAAVTRAVAEAYSRDQRATV